MYRNNNNNMKKKPQASRRTTIVYSWYQIEKLVDRITCASLHLCLFNHIETNTIKQQQPSNTKNLYGITTSASFLLVWVCMNWFFPSWTDLKPECLSSGNRTKTWKSIAREQDGKNAKHLLNSSMDGWTGALDTELEVSEWTSERVYLCVCIYNAVARCFSIVVIFCWHGRGNAREQSIFQCDKVGCNFLRYRFSNTNIHIHTHACSSDYPFCSSWRKIKNDILSTCLPLMVLLEPNTSSRKSDLTAL